MGQLSAELNYERRLERYEEEVEDRILNSENWKEELERYLEGAMEGMEERGEGEESKVNEEYEDDSVVLIAANLSKDEEHVKGGQEITTSGRLVLCRSPRRKGRNPRKRRSFQHSKWGCIFGI